jgi:hypothetical protein
MQVIDWTHTCYHFDVERCNDVLGDDQWCPHDHVINEFAGQDGKNAFVKIHGWVVLAVKLIGKVV